MRRRVFFGGCVLRGFLRRLRFLARVIPERAAERHGINNHVLRAQFLSERVPALRRGRIKPRGEQNERAFSLFRGKRIDKGGNRVVKIQLSHAEHELYLAERVEQCMLVARKRQQEVRRLIIRDKAHLVVGRQAIREGVCGGDMLVVNQKHRWTIFHDDHYLRRGIHGSEKYGGLRDAIIQDTKILFLEPAGEIAVAVENCYVQFDEFRADVDYLLWRSRFLRLTIGCGRGDGCDYGRACEEKCRKNETAAIGDTTQSRRRSNPSKC